MLKHIEKSLHLSMKVGVLYSGGKDSNLALYKASKYFEISCLINIKPESEESMLFHYPTTNLVRLQAKALDIPLIQLNTKNDEESQLLTLKHALEIAKEKYQIEGIVTGAIRSVYQASRFQKICDEVDLWCFNPLWLRDPISILKEILTLKFDVIITRFSSYPFKRKFVGSKIDEKFIEEIKKLNIDPAGEGGEYETFVLWMPLFRKRIAILEAEKVIKEYEGNLIIRRATLI